MRQSYEIPEVSVVYFENEDIVTESLQAALYSWNGERSDNDAGWGDIF